MLDFLEKTMSTAELATSFAALILADDGVDVTVYLTLRQIHTQGMLMDDKPDKLLNLIKAANIECVETVWTILYAKALAVKSFIDLMFQA